MRVSKCNGGIIPPVGKVTVKVCVSVTCGDCSALRTPQASLAAFVRNGPTCTDDMFLMVPRLSPSLLSRYVTPQASLSLTPCWVHPYRDPALREPSCNYRGLAKLVVLGHAAKVRCSNHSRLLK